MFPKQYEELRINHWTPLLVVTMPYACRFLWQADYIEDFKCHLHFQVGVAFWRAILREVYFNLKGPVAYWRALKTSILDTDCSPGLWHSKKGFVLSNTRRSFVPSNRPFNWSHHLAAKQVCQNESLRTSWNGQLLGTTPHVAFFVQARLHSLPFFGIMDLFFRGQGSYYYTEPSY